MKSGEREICGFFTVENENHEFSQVVVIQDLLPNYSKEERYSKTFRLDSLDGVTVYRTKDPDIFKLANGRILKKRNR